MSRVGHQIDLAELYLRCWHCRLQPVSLGMTAETLRDILTQTQQKGMNDGPFRPPTRAIARKQPEDQSPGLTLLSCCLQLEAFWLISRHGLAFSPCQLAFNLNALDEKDAELDGQAIAVTYINQIRSSN